LYLLKIKVLGTIIILYKKIQKIQDIKLYSSLIITIIVNIIFITHEFIIKTL